MQISAINSMTSKCKPINRNVSFGDVYYGIGKDPNVRYISSKPLIEDKDGNVIVDPNYVEPQKKENPIKKFFSKIFHK